MRSVSVAPKNVKSAPVNRLHCRICSYRPRGSLYAKSLAEQVINHIRKKHAESMLDFFSELDILFGQEKGDDTRCLFHASDRKMQP